MKKDIKELAEELFTEISSKYGEGDLFRRKWDERRYTVQKLDEKNPHVEFDGYIGHSVQGNVAMFVLWNGCPDGERRHDISGPTQRLWVVAGLNSADDEVSKMKEVFFCDAGSMGRLNILNSPSTYLIGEILVLSRDLLKKFNDEKLLDGFAGAMM